MYRCDCGNVRKKRAIMCKNCLNKMKQGIKTSKVLDTRPIIIPKDEPKHFIKDLSLYRSTSLNNKF
jgi:hypothetical protein